MKKRHVLVFVLLLPAYLMFAQEDKMNSIPLIGDDAPAFSAMSTNGTIHFPEDYGKKWKILLSHPLDYTPVCSSELLELAYLQEDFNELGVKLVVVSTDNLERHKEWIESMESLTYKERGPVDIKYPLVDDHSKAVAAKYGMIHPNTSTTKDVRGVFIIDPDNKVRTIAFYPMEVGRNMEEIKRMVIALQTVDKEVVVTPANWNPGDDVMVPYTKGSNKGDNNVTMTDDPSVYHVAWYMTFKRAQ